MAVLRTISQPFFQIRCCIEEPHKAMRLMHDERHSYKALNSNFTRCDASHGAKCELKVRRKDSCVFSQQSLDTNPFKQQVYVVGLPVH